MKHFLITITFIYFGLFTYAQKDFWDKLYTLESDSSRVEYVMNNGGLLLYKSPDEFQRVISFLDSVYNETHIIEVNACNLLFKSSRLQRTGHIDTAIVLQKKALSLISGLPSSKLHSDLYNNISICYYKKGDFVQQLVYTDSAITIARALNLTNQEITFMQNRAFIKRELGQTEEAIETLNLLFEKSGASAQSATILINLGTLYSDLLKYDSALVCYQKAVEIADKHQEWSSKAAALTDICELKILLDSSEDISPQLHLADSIFQELNDVDKLFRVQAIRCQYNYLNKNNTEANANSIELVNSAENLDNAHALNTAYKLRSKILEANENWQEALVYYKKYRSIQDSIINKDLKAQLAELEVKFETTEKQRRLELLEKQNEIDRKREILRYSIGASIIILLALIVVVVVFLSRQRNLKNKQKQILLEKEIEDHQLELDQKNRQLTSKALHLSERHELLEEILSIAKDDSENGLDQIKRKIKSKLNSESDWEEFRIYFEELNPDFFSKVKSIKPDLTDRELRLLALIKIGLNIREVANLLHIESNSVKVARYRLKKKFELDTEDTLEAFVNRV